MQGSDYEKIVKEAVEEFLRKMGFSSTVEIVESPNDDQSKNDINIVGNIKEEKESNLLIGQGGVNLQAIQYIIRLILRKKINEKIGFVVDVNNYKQEKGSSVVDLAKNSAEQAIQEKRVIVLSPMSSYERRLVHIELAKNKQVITESIGEGEARKVIIKPIGLMGENI